MGPYDGVADTHVPGHLDRCFNRPQGPHSTLPDLGVGLAEVTYLRSRVSALEHLLAECRNEKSETHHVVSYLLKLNARAASLPNTSARTGHVQCMRNTTSTEAEMRDVWKAITGILLQLADIRDSACIQPPDAASNVPCGDLLGSLDEQPSLEAQDDKVCSTGETLHPERKHLLSAQTANAGPKGHIEGGVIKQLSEKAANAQAHLQSFESEAFSRGSYIRRFGHAHEQRAVSVNHPVRPHSQVSPGTLFSLVARLLFLPY